uniref:Uncharacterized protein n=1 Tax=Rhizophora mucronata TaxID=61149 RepID=A0A2P2Q724_RHIMU
MQTKTFYNRQKMTSLHTLSTNKLQLLKCRNLLNDFSFPFILRATSCVM